MSKHSKYLKIDEKPKTCRYRLGVTDSTRYEYRIKPLSDCVKAVLGIPIIQIIIHSPPKATSLNHGFYCPALGDCQAVLTVLTEAYCKAVPLAQPAQAAQPKAPLKRRHSSSPALPRPRGLGIQGECVTLMHVPMPASRPLRREAPRRQKQLSGSLGQAERG